MVHKIIIQEKQVKSDKVVKLTNNNSRMRFHGCFLLEKKELKVKSFYNVYQFLKLSSDTHRGPVQHTSTMWVMKYTALK